MSVQLPPPSLHVGDSNHLFMSYASQDRPFVERLAQDLREHGHIVWIDFEGIRGGDQWKQSIADALHPSKLVLLVLSPDAVASAWVEEEIETARTLGKKIIPLMLRPIQDVQRPNLAWVVQEIQYRDFTQMRYEHVLTELLKDLPRPESGIAGHCQRLIARLAATPWGLDHYIQEEARLLPVDASPYEDGMVQAQRENLIRRLWGSERLLVLGEPGVGKTVALERLSWELASADPAIVPITVKLLMYDGQPLLEWIRLDLAQTGEIKLATLEATRKFLHQRDLTCYFLLDGLNEVRPAYRGQLLGEITRLALEYPQHRLVVTSRIQDESWHTLRQSGVIRASVVVQTIHPEQALAYLVAHLGSADGQTLWEQLDGKMRGLAATPLLLWFIKEAWLEARERQTAGPVRVPENRGELYHNFVRRMLRRDDERRLNQTYLEHERLMALEQLAFEMNQLKALTLSRERAIEVVGNPQIIEALLVNGLLMGERELRFSPHQTLQEHFAALAIQEAVLQRVRKRGVGKLLQRMGAGRGPLDYANDGWWTETFIQLAGLTDDPNALAQTLAELNPWLAWWCVQEGHKVNHATQAKIEARSIALINSPQVEDRRRAAQTLMRFQSPRTILPLSKLIFDADEEVAQLARTAIRQQGEAAVHVLIEMLESQALVNQETKLVLLSMLKSLSSLEATKGLIQLIHDKDPEIVTAATGVVIDRGSTDHAFLDQVLTSVDHPVRVVVGRGIAPTDSRQGVGLEESYPSIAWCKVVPLDKGGLDYPFYLSKYPVTVKQYQAFIDAGGYQHDQYWTQAGKAWKSAQISQDLLATPSKAHPYQQFPAVSQPAFWHDPDWGLLNHPVVGISWYEAVAFANWCHSILQNHMKVAIRLPTRKEWLVAAGFGVSAGSPHRSKVDYQAANFLESAIYHTTAVGMYPHRKGKFGVEDMLGNVWEWCFGDDHNNEAGESEHVMMGGSYFTAMNTGGQWPPELKARPEFRASDYGFRICAVPLQNR